MGVIFDAARAGDSAPTLLIMLPAAYTAPEDFVRAGFVSALRGRRLDIDLVLAGFDLPQVSDGTAVRQLRQELILPARSSGRTVWLGGISLGGYLALCCAHRHAAELSGLCLLAPYLGSHLITGEVERARGVGDWEPGEAAEADDERRVWRFIKTLRSGALPVHLGLGRDDRFAPRHRLMAAALAPGSVNVVPGGHDWPTWLLLWENFLDAQFKLGAAPA
jgi:pimeloyl-ACP methyl ester carboxylesterase